MCYLFLKVATNWDLKDLLGISAAGSLQRQTHVQARPNLMSVFAVFQIQTHYLKVKFLFFRLV